MRQNIEEIKGLKIHQKRLESRLQKPGLSIDLNRSKIRLNVAASNLLGLKNPEEYVTFLELDKSFLISKANKSLDSYRSKRDNSRGAGHMINSASKCREILMTYFSGAKPGPLSLISTNYEYKGEPVFKIIKP